MKRKLKAGDVVWINEVSMLCTNMLGVVLVESLYGIGFLVQYDSSIYDLAVLRKEELDYIGRL